eukprot:scaffold12836_cov17-Tisochrysis_lutea.AAC.1
MHPHLCAHHPALPHCPSTSTHGQPLCAFEPVLATLIPGQQRSQLCSLRCEAPRLHTRSVLHPTYSASTPGSTCITSSSRQGLTQSTSSKDSDGTHRHGLPTEEASRLLTSRISACTSTDQLQRLLRSATGLQLLRRGIPASPVTVGINHCSSSGRSSSRSRGGSSSSSSSDKGRRSNGSSLPNPTHVPGTPSDSPSVPVAARNAFPVPLTDYHVSAVCVRCADLATDLSAGTLAPKASNTSSRSSSSSSNNSSSPHHSSTPPATSSSADHPSKRGSTKPEHDMWTRSAGQPSTPLGRKQVLAFLRDFLQ